MGSAKVFINMNTNIGAEGFGNSLSQFDAATHANKINISSGSF